MNGRMIVPLVGWLVGWFVGWLVANYLFSHSVNQLVN